MDFEVTQPEPGAQFAAGQSLLVTGICPDGTVIVELVSPFQGNEFRMGRATVIGTAWSCRCSFNTGGNRTILARILDSDGQLVASTQLQVVIDSFGDLIPIPTDINAGLTSCSEDTMIELLGIPCPKNADCTSITNPNLLGRLVHGVDVGPITVSGLQPAVQALDRIFGRVRQDNPALFAEVGTAGMLCCRKRRHGTKYSNHSWGTAVDLTIGGVLVDQGDPRAQRGMALLAPHFNAEKFYWGAGFSGDSVDSMHFEASEELIAQWKSTGGI